MKKAGEKVKSAAAHIVFVALLIVGLYFAVSTVPSLTGHAVLDATTAKAKLESALQSTSMFSQVAQGSICIAINDPEQPLSLQAKKTAEGWTVSEMVGYCSGLNNEDLVVQFPDYDSFSQIVDNPSPRNIAGGAIRQDYHVLPSKYVERGGNVLCDATFKVKFCGALKNMASAEQLIDADLTCCLDTLTRDQKKLLQQHLEDGNYKDEIGLVEESPGGMNTIIMAGIGGLVLVLLIGAVAVMMKGKGKSSKDTGKAKQSTAGAGLPKPITDFSGAAGAASSAGSAAGTTGAMPGVFAAGVETSAQAAQQAAQTAIQAARGAVQAGAPDTQVTELRNYVMDAMRRGYSADEIRAHLLEIGWDAGTSDKVLQDAWNRLSSG
ncbi:hypothetical protein KY362_03535 [Candidatus Woesearchaeota archaeon]|nr:hypothetical protein [Candidatus Woesearchaeota archaeon]